MKYFSIFILLLLTGCIAAKLPEERLNQYQLDNSYEFNNDRLNVYLNNTLQCPVRIWVQPEDYQLKSYFDQINPITLQSLGDTIIEVATTDTVLKKITFASRLGDTSKLIEVKKVELPYPKNREYRLIQGYNSTPTHNSDWSRYALDFDLAEGDTICSATQGYVVGVIEDYKYGGAGIKWKNFGNFITIYDSLTGLFTQYAHLKHKGSLVSVGDKIQLGQKIGIAGITGQTNIEHLHFNSLKPINSEDGLISIPIDSIGNYKISEIKRNDLLKREK
jgi:hypothetical protein